MTIKAQEIILAHAVELIRPLSVASDSPEAMERLLGFIGWDAAAAGLSPTDVQKAFEACKTVVEQVEALIQKGVEDIVALTEGLQAMIPGFEAVRGIIGKWQNPGDLPASVPQTFIDDLFFWLLDVYVTQRMGRAQAVLELVGLITRTPHEGILRPNGMVVRQPMVRMRVDFSQAGRMLKDPTGLIRDRFVNSETGRRAADAVFDLLAPYLVQLLNEFGLDAFYGTPGAPADPNLTEAQRALAARFLHLTCLFAPENTPAAISRLDTIVSLVEINNAFALVVSPVGSLAVDTKLGPLTFKLASQGTIQPLIIASNGVSFQDDTNPQLALDLMVGRHPLPKEGPLLRLGGETGTRFVVGTLDIHLRANLRPSGLDVDFQYLPSGVSLTIARSDGDGFLNKVLPESPIEAPVDLGLGWSNRRGLYFHGGAGLAVTLPIHKDILGILKVETIALAILIRGSDQTTVQLELMVAVSAGLKLGPFLANVERVGLKATLTFPESGGNLGPANLALGFKPPDGAGMSINASAITGGGYLLFDQEKEQYAGILYLAIKDKIAITAIGLLTTRLPDGRKGFSLLLIITAEFPPIQLGYGFVLMGVGGLVGVNRTMLLDVLRAGIKNKTLDSILFPKNPIANAPKIISDLQAVFPPDEGRFVFGPMAKIAWGGAYPILTIELGILIELGLQAGLPTSVRLALLGKVTLALPRREKPEDKIIVYLNLDIMGLVDFDKSDASVDATLFDSRIAEFPITGDMAMRLNWGASSTFVMAAGGFHPRFQPPPNFPALDRLAISIAKGDNPRLRLESYMAITANTVQFGARLDVYVAYAGFTGAAFLAFDALVEFPFHVVVDIAGGVVVKWKGKSILTATLFLTLAGPGPWSAVGEATFHFLGFKRQLPINLTSGEALTPEPLPPSQPFVQLQNQFKDSQNWSAQLPPAEHMNVTLRQAAVAEGVLVHPLGGLTMRQTVVPLDVAISRFANTTPDTPGPFVVEKITFGNGVAVAEQASVEVRDNFAPAQFFQMSDEEKLGSPAFQPLPAGRTRIGTVQVTYSEKSIPRALGYDTVVIDALETRAVRRAEDGILAYAMPSDVLVTTAALGAAGRSPLRSTGSAIYAGPTDRQVKLKDPEYVVASAEDMSVDAATGHQPSEVEARQRLKQKGARGYQVVGSHEVI